MWNSITLKIPLTYTYKSESPLIDISAIPSILNDAYRVLSVRRTLELDFLLLSRCVYRMKLRCRNDKKQKLVDHTVKVLRGLLHFNMVHVLTKFMNVLPKKGDQEIYLPSKQMLEYVLVRLQGYAKLCGRVVECAKNTAAFLNQHLHLGFYWELNLCILALISRIWLITKLYTEKCCSLYNTLLPLRAKLELKKAKWLPDDYIFPNDLAEWLNFAWLNEAAEVAAPVQLEIPIYSLLDDSDDEVVFCSEFKMNDCMIIDDDEVQKDASLILIEDNEDSTDSNDPSKDLMENGADVGESSINEQQIDYIKKLFENPSNPNDEDVGETIPREIININNVVKKKKRNNKNEEYVPKLSTRMDLKMFLKCPSAYYAEVLPAVQWNELHRDLTGLYKLMRKKPLKVKHLLKKATILLKNAIPQSR